VVAVAVVVVVAVAVAVAVVVVVAAAAIMAVCGDGRADEVVRHTCTRASSLADVVSLAGPLGPVTCAWVCCRSAVERDPERRGSPSMLSPSM
jgi:hypothetical protein